MSENNLPELSNSTRESTHGIGEFDTALAYEIGVPATGASPHFVTFKRDSNVTLSGAYLHKKGIKNYNSFFEKNPLQKEYDTFRKYADPKYTWYIMKIEPDGNKVFFAQGSFHPQKLPRKSASPLNDDFFRNGKGQYDSSSQLPSHATHIAQSNSLQSFVNLLEEQLRRKDEDIKRIQQSKDEEIKRLSESSDERYAAAMAEKERYRSAYEGYSDKIIQETGEKLRLEAELNTLKQQHAYEIEHLQKEHERQLKEQEEEIMKQASNALNDSLNNRQTAFDKLMNYASPILDSPQMQNLVSGFLSNKFAQFLPPHPHGLSPEDAEYAQMALNDVTKRYLRQIQPYMTMEEFQSYSPQLREYLEQIGARMTQQTAQQQPMQQTQTLSSSPASTVSSFDNEFDDVLS